MNKSNVCRYPSPLGTILLAAKNGALTEARFVDEPADASAPSVPVLRDAANWLDRYFSGRDPGPIPPCAPEGTAFQKAVWEALRSVPYGETVSYGALAASLGYGVRHARAVGAAVSKNPIVLFLPCHRVIGTNGALTGYAYGTERKSALLLLESRQPSV